MVKTQTTKYMNGHATFSEHFRKRDQDRKTMEASLFYSCLLDENEKRDLWKSTHDNDVLELKALCELELYYFRKDVSDLMSLAESLEAQYAGSFYVKPISQSPDLQISD